MSDRAAIDQIKPFLRDYLLSQGVEINGSGMFKCINPEHEDSNPSCGFVKDNPEVFHCFGCNMSGTIFHAAHWLEQLPISDKLFYHETVVDLAGRFGVTYNPSELSEPEKLEYMKLRAFHDASRAILTYSPSGSVPEYIKERGWTEETTRALGIGGIDDPTLYLKRLLSLGWKREYLEAEGLLRKDIFSKNNLIFTIRDAAGAVVAFAGRKMRGLKEDEPKYVNSAAWTRYTKGAMFYNLDKAKKFTPPVYLFEGYGAVVSAYQAGLHRAVALCCNSLSKEQIAVLSRNQQSKVIICLDGDKEGQKGTQQVLHTLMEASVFDIKIIKLPSDTDPDTFIRTNGIEAFQSLKHYTPFEWQLEEMTIDLSVDLHDLCNKMIPTIRQEQNRIVRDKLVKILSEHTTVPTTVIRKELQRLDDEFSAAKADKIADAKHSLIQRLQRGEDARYAATDFVRQLDDVENLYTPDDCVEDEYVTAAKAVKELLDSTQKLPGFNCGRYKILQQVIDGWPKDQCLMAFAGKPNIGKTSFLRALAWEMACANKDAFVLYMSIDDTREKMFPPIIALDQNLTIAQVKNPKHRLMNPDEVSKYEAGWNRVAGEMSSRFVIKDAQQGNTLDALERHIRFYQNKFPDKKPIVFLDNFHKLGEFSKGPELRQIAESCSQRIKLLSGKYNLPIAMTCELRKMEVLRRPRNEDIKETGKIEYDCDMIVLCHQELHDDANTSLCWTSQEEGRTIKKPIFEIRFAKNKVGDFKGTLFLLFDPLKNRFQETNLDFMETMNERAVANKSVKREDSMSIRRRVNADAGAR